MSAALKSAGGARPGFRRGARSRSRSKLPSPPYVAREVRPTEARSRRRVRETGAARREIDTSRRPDRPRAGGIRAATGERTERMVSGASL